MTPFLSAVTLQFPQVCTNALSHDLSFYSLHRLGASDDDFNALSEREGPLFFAGEATYWDHFATVHGAILSGTRAAAEIKAELTRL